MVYFRKEELRINAVYRKRDTSGKNLSYAWHKPDVAYMTYRQRASWACALGRAGFEDLSFIDMLDIGCGSGGWLRMMMEWGADPGRLHGVDLLKDRIAKSKIISQPPLRRTLFISRANSSRAVLSKIDEKTVEVTTKSIDWSK